MDDYCYECTGYGDDKKPVVIEAVQWNGHNLEEIKEFVGDSMIYEIFDAAWKVGKDAPAVYMKLKHWKETINAT